MKAKITQLLCLVVVGLILAGLVEGCSEKKASKTTQNRPAQKKMDKATEDF